jgi:hypothetical protein
MSAATSVNSKTSALPNANVNAKPAAKKLAGFSLIVQTEGTFRANSMLDIGKLLKNVTSTLVTIDHKTGDLVVNKPILFPGKLTLIAKQISLGARLSATEGLTVISPNKVIGVEHIVKGTFFQVNF